MTDETQSRVREIHLVDQTLRHLMFAFVGVLIGLAGMMIVNAPARAEALCGGLDERGQLQQSCQGRPAKYEGKPATTCPEHCWRIFERAVR